MVLSNNFYSIMIICLHTVILYQVFQTNKNNLHIGEWFQVCNTQWTRVQILDETCCISHSTNTLGKGMNPIIFPPAMGK